MDVYFDTEFNERQVKAYGLIYTFHKVIDLISIGLTDDNNRSLYMVSKEFDVRKAFRNDWIRENVLLPIYWEFKEGTRINSSNVQYYNHWLQSNRTLPEHFITGTINNYGYTNLRIRDKITEFTADYDYAQFIGYYCSYDWVILSQLYNSMLEMPKNFNLYPLDLRLLLLTIIVILPIIS